MKTTVRVLILTLLMATLAPSANAANNGPSARSRCLALLQELIVPISMRVKYNLPRLKGQVSPGTSSRTTPDDLDALADYLKSVEGADVTSGLNKWEHYRNLYGIVFAPVYTYRDEMDFLQGRKTWRGIAQPLIEKYYPLWEVSGMWYFISREGISLYTSKGFFSTRLKPDTIIIMQGLVPVARVSDDQKTLENF